VSLALIFKIGATPSIALRYNTLTAEVNRQFIFIASSEWGVFMLPESWQGRRAVS
jgi:hypothetical protein